MATSESVTATPFQVTVTDIVIRTEESPPGYENISHATLNISYHATEDSPIFIYSYLVLLIIFTTMGNVGNVCVIGAVFSDRRLWKESNVFIVNLAIADLLVTGKCH